jgi:hypothetical protein
MRDALSCDTHRNPARHRRARAGAGAGVAYCAEGEDQRHIAINGKTMGTSKGGDGHATHVLSAFCAGLQSILGNEASRGKGMEIPDALQFKATTRHETSFPLLASRSEF